MPAKKKKSVLWRLLLIGVSAYMIVTLAGLWSTLNESKAIMHGHKMDLFVLYLSFILWDILVCFTFGIASVYVLPYQSATIANFYQNIKRKPQVTAEADMI